LAIGVADLTGIVCSCGESSKDPGGLGIPSGSAPEKPVASGWLTGLHRFMSLRWRAVSILSKIFISAPVIKLRTWKVLVWSEARVAEGEKEKRNDSFQHTPKSAGMSAVW
jgi:hypothetical protein